MATTRTRPGEYRHPVTVEAQSTAKGSMGETVYTWSTFASIRCKIWPGKGTEAAESRWETGKLMNRFFCRYIPGITLGMRLKFGTRYYDIVSVANIGELNRELEIAAVETI